MRKIHHGFIAFAILGGSASIILAHQRLTETFRRRYHSCRHRGDRAADLLQMRGSPAARQTLPMR